jgi:hypothetical protein
VYNLKDIPVPFERDPLANYELGVNIQVYRWFRVGLDLKARCESESDCSKGTGGGSEESSKRASC